MSRSDAPELKITDLPSDLHLHILEECPDMSTLKNMALSHPRFYYLFEPRSELIATKILRRKVPDEIFTILRTTIIAEDLALPNILILDRSEQMKPIDRIPDGREDNPSEKASVAEASAMEKLFDKIDGLAEAYIDDTTKWDKVTTEDVSVATVQYYNHLVRRFEVHQAICVFEILRGILGRKNVAKNHDWTARASFFLQVDEIRYRLMHKRAISRWQMHVSNVVEDYLQRKLIKFNIAEYKRNRVMPDPADQGIDFFHKHMCKQI